MRKNLLLIVLLICNYWNTYGQRLPIPAEDCSFSYPLEIPLILSGTFGELRNNHFHSGIDIKTKGSIGHKILSADTGYVSRIKISPWGYGNAIYIDHPNGYTSVYGHLSKFGPKILKEIEKHQHEIESWELDWYVPDTLIPVSKGEWIAQSGNTGGSQAPHLHFEIRETGSEFPTNPLLYEKHFGLKDNIPPQILSIMVYPIGKHSNVNGKKTPQRFYPKIVNGQYKILQKIVAKGTIGVGIQCFDRLNGAANKNGVYQITLNQNGAPIFQHKMDKFSFDNSRCINTHTDYRHRRSFRAWIQKSFLDPGNTLSIYDIKENNGYITFSDTSTASLVYEVNDIHNNKSLLSFKVMGRPSFEPEPHVPVNIGNYFHYNKDNHFSSEEICSHIPQGILYNDILFNPKKKAKIPMGISPVYQVGKTTIPLHNYIAVGIKTPDITEKRKTKILMVNCTQKNKIRPLGKGKIIGGYYIDSTKTFGDFCLMIDEIKPVLVPINIYENKNMKKNTAIIFRVGDNLSGVKSYRGTIDDKWVTFEYHPKRGRLIHYFKDLPTGKHILHLTAIDGVGNKQEVKMSFIR